MTWICKDLCLLQSKSLQAILGHPFFIRKQTSWPNVIVWIVFPSPNSYVDTLTLNMTIIRDRVLKEVLKVESSHESGVLFNRTGVCVIGRGIRSSHIQEMPCEDTARMCMSASRGERTQQETNFASTLIFHLPELWKEKCPLFKSPRQWYSVLAN